MEKFDGENIQLHGIIQYYTYVCTNSAGTINRLINRLINRFSFQIRLSIIAQANRLITGSN